ncbi:MAG: hypothetical protein V4735_02780 [Pseudomonadota bacterium]
MKYNKRAVTGISGALLAVTSVIVASGNHALAAGSTGAGSPNSVHVTVANNTSPISDTVGVKTTTADGTAIYILVPSIATKESAAMTIKAGSQAGVDVTQLIGKAVFEFANIPRGVSATVVVEATSKVKEVLECNAVQKKCLAYPFERINPTQVSFAVKADRFYALLP